MRLKIFLILSMAVSVYAQNLQEILDSLAKSKKINSIKAKRDSEIANNELLFSYDAPSLGATVAHAKDTQRSGSEYTVIFSQNISHPFSSGSKKNATDFATKSFKQAAVHDMHIASLEVASKYHSACVAKEMQESAAMLLSMQNERFAKVKKAYELGEVSKKDMLFNKLDLVKLSKKTNGYKREYLQELSSLQQSAENIEINSLSCSDLLNLTEDVKLGNIDEHDEIKDLEFQQKSSLASYDVYSAPLSSIGYFASFADELDTKRYAVGISIPLSSLTAQKEQARTKYLNHSSSIGLQKESLKKEIELSSKSLQIRIKTLYNEHYNLKNEVIPLSEELVKLSKIALDEGEGMILEYIDASRSYSENMLEMLEIKKSYYKELFELYKVADKEFGEII
ncbi:TolC family protein [Sulfurimonas sp.]|uniref:TolC family protein n=1 Tax=Sulfurimonas sp. TaxID=2022749 RepID=UPI00261118A3|nr:TolC family protein [Sulfurimonas sp.]MDD5157352.1 TolC family protein [Sulfurimonas sp.]